MKLPFKRRDPDQALQAGEAALAATESGIADLVLTRSAKLLETDDISEVDAIDRQIEAQHRAAGIHRDRIKALRSEVARANLEKLQAQHAARVAETEKALTNRDATALKLEIAVREFGRLYFELVDRNVEISRLWGFSDNARRVGLLSEPLIGREVSHLLFALGRPQGGVCRLPAPGNVGLGVTGDANSGTLAERIAASSAALLEMIKAVPVQQPENEVAA